MTETAWLDCAEPYSRLKFLRGKRTDCKLRLFACACCRRLFPHLPTEEMRQAVILA